MTRTTTVFGVLMSNGVYFIPTASQNGAWKRTSSVAAGIPAVGLIVKAAPAAASQPPGGRVRLIRVTNHSGAIIFFQVFDATVLPTTTATVATDRAQVGIGLTAVMDYGPEGLVCANGIVIAHSSTSAVFTTTGTADSDVMIEWL